MTAPAPKSDTPTAADSPAQLQPAQNTPTPPAKSYPENYVDPPFVSAFPLQSVQARNDLIIRFLRSVSFFLFYIGGAAGLCVILYQRILKPKLEIKAKIITQLKERALAISDKHLEAVKSLREDCSHFNSVEKEVEVTVEKEVDPEQKEQAEQEEPQTETRVETIKVAPDVMAPLKDSLARLKTSLASLSELSPATDEHDLYDLPASTDANSTTALRDSLDNLTSYLTSQTYYAPTYVQSHWGVVKNATLSEADKKDPWREAIHECKTEIRGIKGYLLNRRNFSAVEGGTQKSR